MIFFVIPVYNESNNILNLYNELAGALPGEKEITFVFSDDGSTDNTTQKIQELFRATSHVVLGDGINRGPGYAFNTAFNWVLENSKSENDQVISIEADCTSDTSILKNMLTINRLGYSLVLASVYAQGGTLEKTNFIRKLISSLANIFMRFVFGIKVLTLSSFYRVYSVSLLRQIKNNFGEIIKERGFICMLELLHKAIKLNATIIEVPTVLKSSKRVGHSKMKIVKTSFQYLNYLWKSGIMKQK